MLSRLRHRPSRATLNDTSKDGAGTNHVHGLAVLSDSSSHVQSHNERSAKASSSYSTSGLFSSGPRRPSLRTMQSESMLAVRRPRSLPTSNEGKLRRSRTKSLSKRGSEAQTTTIGTAYIDTSAAFPAPIPVTVRPRTAGAPSRVAGIDVPIHRTTSSGSTRPSTSHTSNKSFAAAFDLTSPTIRRGSLPKLSDVRSSAFSRGSDSDQEVRPKTPRVEVGLASPPSSRARLRLPAIPSASGMDFDDDPKSPLDAAKWADTAYAEIERFLAQPSSLEQPNAKVSRKQTSSVPQADKDPNERVPELSKTDGTAEKKEDRGRTLIAPLNFRGTLAQRRRGTSVSSIQTVDTSILARTPTAEKFQFDHFEADLEQAPLPLNSPIYLEYTKAAGTPEMPNTCALQPSSTQYLMNEPLVPDTPALISNFPRPRSSQSPPTLIVPMRENPLIPDTPALISSFPTPRVTVTRESQLIVPRTSPRPSENPTLRSSTITRPVPSQNFDWLDLGIANDNSENELDDVIEQQHVQPGG